MLFTQAGFQSLTWAAWDGAVLHKPAL